MVTYPFLAFPYPNIQNNKTRMLRDNYYKENRIQNTKIISLFRFHLLIYSLYRSITTFPIPLSSVPPSKSRQAAVHSSRLRYSHPSLELPPYFHRLHVLRSSCIHTIGCPCLPWHCQPHPVEAWCGGCPSCLSRSSQTQAGKV